MDAPVDTPIDAPLPLIPCACIDAFVLPTSAAEWCGCEESTPSLTPNTSPTSSTPPPWRVATRDPAARTMEGVSSLKVSESSSTVSVCRVECVAECCRVLQCVAVCCSVLQYVAVCCSALQCVAVCCSILQCVAVCCSVLQCVAVCCSALQCVAVCCSTRY